MLFYIICMLTKAIINLKSGHKNSFVASNVILVSWNIFFEILDVLMKHYIFFHLASMKTIVSC